NGAIIPERWQGVVNVLLEGGEQLKTIGGKNVYENVAPRTCRLAWDKFKSDHHKHIQAQRRLTGAVENEDFWTNLVRSVVELEEVELDKKKETTESRKRSAELMEQGNREGALLVDASLARMRRASNTTSDGSAVEDSGTAVTYFSRSKRNRRHELQQQISQKATQFIDNAQQIIATSTQKQQDNYGELMQTPLASQQQMHIGFTQLAQAQAEAVDRQVAASDRQTAA
ncbi:hypothetical protein BGZ46_006452, partial [Entomortierella lignicola]